MHTQNMQIQITQFLFYVNLIFVSFSFSGVNAEYLRQALNEIGPLLNAEDDRVIQERFARFPAANRLCYMFTEATNRVAQHSLGQFGRKVCPHCRAMLWPQQSSSFCCFDGDHAGLDHIKEPPAAIQDLYNTNGQFLSDLKYYNDSLCLATFHCDSWDQRVTGVRKMMSVQGRVWHNVGNLKPNPLQRAFPGQLYFYDGSAEAIARERAGLVNVWSAEAGQIQESFIYNGYGISHGLTVSLRYGHLIIGFRFEFFRHTQLRRQFCFWVVYHNGHHSIKAHGQIVFGTLMRL